MIEIPKECPSCGFSLTRVKDQLFCKNPSCASVLEKKLVHFAKTMQIKGLGEKTIQKLNISNIEDIYLLTKDYLNDILGEKIGDKVYSEIEKSKHTTLDKFLAACSIPLVGISTARKLAEVIASPADITAEICKSAGLGQKATTNLLEWKSHEYDTTLNKLPLTFAKKKKPAISVCISGRIPGYTKAQIAEKLEKYNVSVINNVTTVVKYVIADPNSTTAKVVKAKCLGIPVLTLDEFIEEIKS